MKPNERAIAPLGTPPAWLAPVVVTLLGAFLRFYRLADWYPNLDHDYPIAQAIRWLQLGQWPLLGQGTSVLFANPAGMSYVMAVPWVLFGSQWGATFFSTLLNLLAVPLTYRAGRLAGGRRAGLAAAALAATNPWIIYFSRLTWVQGLLPFWATLTCTLLLVAVFERRLSKAPARRFSQAPNDDFPQNGVAGRSLARPATPFWGSFHQISAPDQNEGWKALFAALVALTGLTQMYLLALLSIAPAGLILLLNWKRLPRRALLAGAAVLALATGLYGLQLARDWPNQSPKVVQFFQTGKPAALDASAFDHAMRMVTGADYAAVYGDDGTAGARSRKMLGQVVGTVLAAVLGLGVLRAAWRAGWGGADAGVWLAVLIWWGVPIAALTFPTHPPNISYLLLSLPAGYVLAASVLAVPVFSTPKLGQRLRPWLSGWRVGLPALLALGASSFVLVSAAAAQVAAQPGVFSLDNLSVSAVMQLMPVAQAVADQYHLDEFYTPLVPESLTAKVGRPLGAISWTPIPDVVLFRVDHPTVYLRLEQGSRPTALRLAATVAEVDYPGQSFVTFDLIRAYTRAELSALPQHAVDWPSAQGLTLVGYDLAPGQLPLSGLWVYWTVDTLVDERVGWIYAPFAHVMNAQGLMVARAGALGLPGYYYRQGDVFLSRIKLPALPPGTYQLDLGMYDGLHGLSMSMLPPDGAATDQYQTTLVIP